MSSVTVKVIILFVSKAKDRRQVNFESLKEPYHDEYKGNQPLNCFTVLTNVVNIRLFRTLIFGTVGIRCVKARQRRTCPTKNVSTRMAVSQGSFRFSDKPQEKNCLCHIYIRENGSCPLKLSLLSGACFNKKTLP